MSSFSPALLTPRARNEQQDTELTTVKLYPNSHNNYQTKFVLPKQGSVLDSNSSLVWKISWAGYDAAKTGYERVSLKLASGGLSSLLRARFFIGGKQVFSCDDVGALIHIKSLARNPDYQEEMSDKELGSAHGYFLADQGKFQIASDAPSLTGASNRYSRVLGSYSTTPANDKSIECSVLLSDIFSALESLQLPMELDEMRVELDWETVFDEIAVILSEGDGNGGQAAITDARKIIDIKDPVMLLDYLTFNEDLRAGLTETLREGLTLPFVHTSISSKVIPENAVATARTDDVFLSLQGKLLMKMYVSHRFSDSVNGVVQAYQKTQGRIRSQRGKDMSYNLFINDLALHDQPVDTSTKQFAFLEMTSEGQLSTMPGTFDFNSVYGQAPANTDINAASMRISGITIPNVAANTQGLTAIEVRDGVANTNSYIGFDLAKYDSNSRVVPANAGYRVGSSAVILRLTETGSPNQVPERAPKRVQVFTEEVMFMRSMGGQVDVFEA